MVLDSRLAESPPEDPRDTAFITEALLRKPCVEGSGLDYAISQFADRKLDALEDRVLAALRLGTYQLSSRGCRRIAAAPRGTRSRRSSELKLNRAVGFCNAILRKLAGLKERPLPQDGAERFSIQESHPRGKWLP